jgi:hypothetical protein
VLKCKHCDKEKKEEDFYHSKGVRQRRCKDCQKEYATKWYDAHKMRVNFKKEGK